MRVVARWGSTEAERRAGWPGDELVPSPRFVWTNAITIRRPAAEVWPWVAQLGQGRGGLYSYDWLENLIGCGVHSAADLLAGRARGTWAFIVHPAGPGACRLIVRSRGSSLMARLQGPVQFVMQRRSMLGIKERAERARRAPGGG